MLIKLFNSAGATGHVFLLRGGKARDKGLAYSGFIGPKTTVAVVPTTPQILNFAAEAQTRDKQSVVVRGSVPAQFIPETAVSQFDFTVDPSGGEYLGEWQAMLTEADTALHTRRMSAATNERTVRTYEAETAQKLEEERGKLLEEQAKNQQKQASADAAATTTRLAPLKEVEPGLLLGAALMKMADTGVENLSIVPEMFAAMNGHARS